MALTKVNPISINMDRNEQQGIYSKVHGFAIPRFNKEIGTQGVHMTTTFFKILCKAFTSIDHLGMYLRLARRWVDVGLVLDRSWVGVKSVLGRSALGDTPRSLPLDLQSRSSKCLPFSYHASTGSTV